MHDGQFAHVQGARDAGHPVPFIADWANTYTEHDLRRRIHEDVTSGYWWIELGGGRYNTIADAETLRDELLKGGVRRVGSHQERW